MHVPRLECFDPCNMPAVTDEHRQLQAALQRFVDQEISPNVAQWDEDETFPRELYRATRCRELSQRWSYAAPARVASTRA